MPHTPHTARNVHRPAQIQPLIDRFATLWTATLRSIAATQQSDHCNLRQTLNFLSSLEDKSMINGLEPIATVLTKMVSLRQES